MAEIIRAAFVIARRDFVATVFRRTFLLFLIGPLFPLILGVGFGGMGAKLAADATQPVVAVIATPGDFEPLRQARQRLLEALPDSPSVELLQVTPEGNLTAQRARLLAQKSPPVLATLDGGMEGPTLTGDVHRDGRTAAQIDFILQEARLHAAAPSVAGPTLDVTFVAQTGATRSSADSLTARAGQTIMFLLTILLAGAVLSQLIEEKSNKAIEILAAAVRVDAIFVGKLFAMLAISIVGIIVWTACGAIAVAIWSADGLAGLPPAVGWPLFVLLGLAYFATAYLLIGSVFLAIGSQAASVREIQTLNMPVVLGQSLVYYFGASAVGHLDEPRGLAAAVFPLSSPFALIGRAAEQPALWPHVIAIVWQAVWVVLILRGGAALFRRNVLKSGPARRWPWQRRATA